MRRTGWRLRAAAVQPAHPCAQSAPAHQPRHTLATCANACLLQQRVNTRATVAASAGLMQRFDASAQRLVLAGVPARSASSPRAVARAANLELGAEPRDAKAVPFLVDEGEDVALRAEQNRMAFFNSSCSFLSSSCACLSSA
jgi:hypothetical protein